MASLTMFEGRLGEAYSTFMIMNGANEGVQWGRRGGMGARYHDRTSETNIEKLSGPVHVSIDSISAGSVKVASTVVFLNGDSNNAAAYQTAMTSSTCTASSSIFGTSFDDVAVDASSVKPNTVANPKSNAETLSMSIATVLGAWLLMVMLYGSAKRSVCCTAMHFDKMEG
ncbi:TPA: hypothetical protein ACH3X2_009704 [Trebouxia sp. C0005]|nr:MAG: hypothetical protein FRX49_07901 [Trebouxia sp. A1-2]